MPNALDLLGDLYRRVVAPPPKAPPPPEVHVDRDEKRVEITQAFDGLSPETLVRAGAGVEDFRNLSDRNRKDLSPIKQDRAIELAAEDLRNG